MIADANVSPKFPRYKINFVSKLFCTNKKPREDICISVFHLAKLVTKRVFWECKKKSLKCIMQKFDCHSGTDRIAYASKGLDGNIFVNIRAKIITYAAKFFSFKNSNLFNLSIMGLSVSAAGK